MEPLAMAALLGTILAAMLLSATVRGLLSAIFRRPRQTSVFVEVDGRRVEVIPRVRQLEGRALGRASRKADRRHRQKVARSAPLMEPASGEAQQEEPTDGATP